MIDVKIQEVFNYFYSDEIRWRDAIWRGTTLKGVQYYYAEKGLYIFRISYGYHYAYIFIQSNSLERAIHAIADNEHYMVNSGRLPMDDNKKKLQFDDMIANNLVAAMISETSSLCGTISAVHDSINFDKLSEHKRHEILDIEHHLTSALMHLQEYFMVRKEQNKCT